MLYHNIAVSSFLGRKYWKYPTYKQIQGQWKERFWEIIEKMKWNEVTVIGDISWIWIIICVSVFIYETLFRNECELLSVSLIGS